METLTSTRNWPTNEIDAERQAAAYLPLQGNRSDLLPSRWPNPKEEKFPKPATVLRELTAWFARHGPQPMTTIPQCTQRWLTEIPPTHGVMQAGVSWLQSQNEALWPSVAVANLLAMWDSVRHGQPSPFTVPAVQDAVRLWTIDQDMRKHAHEAVQKVYQITHQVPLIDETMLDAMIAVWREVMEPEQPALASAVTKEKTPELPASQN